MLPTDGFIDKVEEATKDDLVIMSKSIGVKDFLYLKEKGIKFVFDICDNKWRLGKDSIENTKIMDAGCRYANLITTTCKELRSKIFNESGKTAIIIDDPFERAIEEPRFEPHKKNLNFCYFGGRKSFSLVDWEEVIAILNFVCKKNGIDYTLNCITQKHLQVSEELTHHLYPDGPLIMYEWNYKLQKDLVSKSDFVLLPVPADGFSPVIGFKSPNRVIDSIAQGRYVITTWGVHSYRNYIDFIGIGSIQNSIKWAINNPKLVLDKIKQGQKYIKKHHSPEVIAKQWMSLRDKV
tara:strand:- start:296 stop:1174 length:879 start_codon:yes stop_codon:yes gene_type:complete